jgi:hypothetical protein
MSARSHLAIAVTVLAAAAGQVAWAAATSAARKPPDPSETLQEVTVTADREKLEARVSKYVNEIAELKNGEGLPRWKKPVCPLVSGLSRQDGEFILDRFSEIARDAAVPLAAEQCRPNLYILVHPKPKELLLAMEKKNFAFTFGSPLAGEEAPLPSVIDRFIATPRAVRVWDISVETNADGMPLGTPEPTTSRLSRPSIWSLSHVFVIVDQTRLRGVTRGQLADYVALVALADLKSGASLGDARTILNLFDGAPESAPAGMSDWDHSFLKSLYATDQAATLQRSQIAHRMVHGIAP